MKTITVTYDVLEEIDGTECTGETCMDIKVEDKTAEKLLHGSLCLAYIKIEDALKALESLQGHTYIRGSIKDIRE